CEAQDVGGLVEPPPLSVEHAHLLIVDEGNLHLAFAEPRGVQHARSNARGGGLGGDAPHGSASSSLSDSSSSDAWRFSGWAVRDVSSSESTRQNAWRTLPRSRSERSQRTRASSMSARSTTPSTMVRSSSSVVV